MLCLCGHCVMSFTNTLYVIPLFPSINTSLPLYLGGNIVPHVEYNVCFSLPLAEYNLISFICSSIVNS